MLESNSTYHFGPPRITTLEFRIYGDAATLNGALRAQEVDGALLPPETPDENVAFLHGIGGYAFRELVSTSLFIVYFDTRSPLFDDVDVRRALIQGVNPSVVADAVSGGRGAPADTGIPSSSWAHTPVETPPFDPGSSARALEAAGWQRANDGVRRKGGTRFSFTLSTSNDPYRVAIAENVAQQLRALGLEIIVQPLAADTYIEEHLLTRQFEAALVEVDPGVDPDPYPFWHATQITPPGRNLAGLDDPQMDDVLERARRNTDPARRKELYELFEGYLLRSAPALLLYAPVDVYVQRERVQGFTPSLLFTSASRFSNVNEWYVRTRVE